MEDLLNRSNFNQTTIIIKMETYFGIWIKTLVPSCWGLRPIPDSLMAFTTLVAAVGKEETLTTKSCGPFLVIWANSCKL